MVIRSITPDGNYELAAPEPCQGCPDSSSILHPYILDSKAIHLCPRCAGWTEFWKTVPRASVEG